MNVEEVAIKHCGDEKDGIRRGECEPYFTGLESVLKQSGFQGMRHMANWSGVTTEMYKSPQVTILHQSQFIHEPTRHTNLYTIVGKLDAVNSAVNLLRGHSQSQGYKPLVFPERMDD